jgi:hypothetical protein
MKMETAADEVTATELERLELLLMDPAVRRDRERVAGLLAEDFQEFGSSGRVWTLATTLEQLRSETYSPPVIECFACRVLVEDVALVTYRAVRSNGATGERKVTLRSSIWVRMSGNWKMRFHQGTRALESDSSESTFRGG